MKFSHERRSQKFARLFLPALALLSLFPLSARAQSIAAVPNPKMSFERSSVVGLDNAIIGYGVPVTSSNGVVSCFDVTVSMAPNADGSLPTTAKVTGVACPTVNSRQIISGNYSAAAGFQGTCTVVSYALQTGRTEWIVGCKDDSGGSLEVTLVNGPVDANHPFYAQLHAAKIDSWSNVKNYIWGIPTLASGGRLGGCGNIYSNYPIGAQQVGASLKLSLFNTAGTFDCTGTLNKH